MLHQDPMQRVSTAEVLAHPWIRGLDAAFTPAKAAVGLTRAGLGLRGSLGQDMDTIAEAEGEADEDDKAAASAAKPPPAVVVGAPPVSSVSGVRYRESSRRRCVTPTPTPTLALPAATRVT